jgi:hypothetical protein
VSVQVGLEYAQLGCNVAKALQVNRRSSNGREGTLQVDLSTEEVTFLLEALGWARYRYDEVVGQYMNIKGYRENQYEPRMKLFAKVIEKLKAASHQ